MTRLVSITPDAEELIAYCARVSNPTNQNNTETAPRLLSYLIKNNHWSPFEMANMVIEIVTTRAISAQILRHRSFTFQEFSQRYAEVPEIIPTAPRRQDDKNRQSSIDDLPDHVQKWWRYEQNRLFDDAFHVYKGALAQGIAKECARMILPMSSKTRLYMNGTIRSWIHYLQLRTGNGTQMEHQGLAEQIKAIFVEQLPAISAALGWKEEENGPSDHSAKLSGEAASDHERGVRRRPSEQAFKPYHLWSYPSIHDKVVRNS